MIDDLHRFAATLLAEGNATALVSALVEENLQARLLWPMGRIEHELPGETFEALQTAAETFGARTLYDLVKLCEREGFRHSELHKALGSTLRRQVQEALAAVLTADDAGAPAAADPTRTDAARAFAPPATATELDAWAAQHHLKGQLRRTLSSVLGEAGDWRTAPLLVRLSPTPTVRELLLDQGDGRVSHAVSTAELAHVRRLSLKALRGAAERIAKGAARMAEKERLRAKLPDSETLRMLTAALGRAGVELLAQPRAEPARRSDAKVSFKPSPARFEVSFDWDAHFRTCSRAVTLDVDELPDGEVAVRCGCGRPSCGNAQGAVDAVLDYVHTPGATQDAVAAAISAPRWKRALQQLDEELLAAEAAPSGKDLRVSFRLRDDDGDLELKPFVHKPLKGGGYSSGTALSRGRDRYEGPQANLVEKVLRVLDSAADGFHRGNSPLYFALELLADSGLLELDGERVPLTVQHGRLLLLAQRQEGGGLTVSPTLDGDRDSTPSVRRQLEERYLVYLDRERRRCVLAELPDELRPLLERLSAPAAPYPPEAQEELLQRLARVEGKLPLLLPQDLEGEEVPPSQVHVLRLGPRGAGLTGMLRMRPLPEGQSHPPGEGPERMTALRGGRRVHVRRELSREPAQAEALLRTLPLGSGRLVGQAQLEIAQPDDALDLLSHLRSRTDLKVEWPADAAPRVIAGTASSAGLRVAIRDKRDWFGVEGEVQVEQHAVSLAQLLTAVREGNRWLQLKGGQWVALSAELREKLAGAATVVHESRNGLEASPAAADALTALTDAAQEADVSETFRAWVARLAGARALDAPLPAGLNATLRPYQLEGYRWLSRLAAWGMGGLLADDMGLGKTLQAIAMLLARAQGGPALVIAPTSVCFNWVRELARFAPSLRAVQFHDTDRAEAIARLGPGDVLVTSYGLLLRHEEELAAARFETLVVDEAQNIKNAQTRRAKAVRALQAGFRLALTGTPVENHLGELWSLLQTVAPGLLGSWDQFRVRFAVPIERDKDPVRRRALARAIRPFVLRRTKAEVLPELPPRTEIRLTVALSPAERKLYDEARLTAVAQLTQGGPERAEQKRFQVLAAITRLRQLACNPRLHDPLSTAPSAKLEAFLELVEELRDNGHRALVFSQFTSHLALVREALDARGVGYLYLDGQTPQAQRAERVDAFQRGQGELFLISLKAGGTGLNLTAADYVVHLDPWWNPAIEDQATDRAHRIGQKKPVTVYRLVSKGTLEEGILSLHEQKRDLVAGVLDGSDAAAKLSTDELVDLIRRGPADEAAEDAA